MNGIVLPAEDAWKDDKLGYSEIGHAFTNLIQSLDTEKVISIEAGFGRGKTFFRRVGQSSYGRREKS